MSDLKLYGIEDIEIQKIGIEEMPRMALFYFPSAKCSDEGELYVDFSNGEKVSLEKYPGILANFIESNREQLSSRNIIFPERAPGTVGEESLGPLYTLLKNLLKDSEKKMYYPGEFQKLSLSKPTDFICSHGVETENGIYSRIKSLVTKQYCDKMFPTAPEREIPVLQGDNFKLMNLHENQIALMFGQDAAALLEPKLEGYMPGEEFIGNTTRGLELKEKIRNANAIGIVNQMDVPEYQVNIFQERIKKLVLRANNEFNKPAFWLDAPNYHGHAMVIDNDKVVARLEGPEEGIIFIN
jgi:hypothetical protein